MSFWNRNLLLTFEMTISDRSFLFSSEMTFSNRNFLFSSKMKFSIRIFFFSSKMTFFIRNFLFSSKMIFSNRFFFRKCQEFFVFPFRLSISKILILFIIKILAICWFDDSHDNFEKVSSQSSTKSDPLGAASFDYNGQFW